MLDTELGYNLLRNDSRGSKSDETLNKRPHDISLARLCDQICWVYQTVNDVSVCYYFSETKISKTWLKNRSINRIFTSTTYWVSELDNCIAAWLNMNPYTWFKTRELKRNTSLKHTHTTWKCRRRDLREAKCKYFPGEHAPGAPRSGPTGAIVWAYNFIATWLRPWLMSKQEQANNE